ncbi:MAG: cation transporter, partial [Micrococcales bacterium]|nr:cation transporter [Micrococcales bacterium]
MTCASCVARVEKKLSRLPGVVATVNLALERAHVTVDPAADVDTQTLIDTIRAAGYDATVLVATPRPPTGEMRRQTPDATSERRVWRATSHLASAQGRGGARLVGAVVLTVPVVGISMVPGWQFPGWQWVVAVLSLPVVTWAAWPFHQAAARAARHGSSTMDTLVSMGVVAATVWSWWALVFGGAGRIGMTMHATLWPAAGAGRHGTAELYFEVGAVVTTFLLAGRYAEGRARRRAGDALRALLDLGAKEVTVLDSTGLDSPGDAAGLHPRSGAVLGTGVVGMGDAGAGVDGVGGSGLYGIGTNARR